MSTIDTIPAEVWEKRSRRGGGRIDYSSIRVMRRRHRDKLAQRKKADAGSWVIGRIVAVEDMSAIQGVPRRQYYTIDDGDEPTLTLTNMARWRTRQAAHQWLRDHPRWKDFRPLNLTKLITGKATR